ncbi:ABC transporter substrate-binding protein [Pelobacter seleniigenes]|uniref:ABC transporter substrate-binding protein n=1 Tax=Pelobacter seleniigenes TaxID=407188 RepID=UPI0004A71DFA|nr:ABC transporter substrate-binding protein [Pelobacter seleniigenes]
MKRILMGLFVFAFTLMSVTGAMASDKLIKGNMRIVIGSKSTGGDTYQNSSIIAEALSKKLGINVKVDAIGGSAGFRTIQRTGQDGTTVMIYHDQAYLGYLYGVKGYEEMFSTYKVGPLLAINPGNAYLVPKKSPYQSVDDIIDACGKGTQVRVAIQPGGVSEIGYTALKNAVSVKYPGKQENLVAVYTGSQADKNQLLFDGQADLINGSVQANEQYTRLPADDQKAMRFVWLTARNQTLEQANPEGMGKTSREELMQFVEPKAWVPYDDKTNFTFDKEFIFLYNKDIKPEIVEYLDNALAEIYAEGKIQQTQKKSFFIPDFMPSTKSAPYFKAKMERIKKIIDGMK